MTLDPEKGEATGMRPGPITLLSKYAGDESGQAATEYILIIGLIVVPLAIAFNELQEVLKGVVNRIAKLLYGPGV